MLRYNSFYIIVNIISEEGVVDLYFSVSCGRGGGRIIRVRALA